MSRIACPYCCEVQAFTGSAVCRKCGLQVPENYLKISRDEPPMYLAAVGFSQHGKTSYINSLAVTLEEMDKVSDTYLEYLDDFTVTAFRNMRSAFGLQQRAVPTTPKSNRDVTLEPLVLSLAHFLETGKRGIVIYDLAGETFSKQDDIELYADPLKLAHTIWFFVSLHDLEHKNQEMVSLADLFNIYLTGMQRVGALTAGRHLHVIYTKADKLSNLLPENIRNYLRADPYFDIQKKKPSELEETPFKPQEYFAQLQTISDELRLFTNEELKRGRAFIRRVEDSEMELSFSITSATGRDTVTRDNSAQEYRAYRVIDPLIWGLISNKGISGLTSGRSGQQGRDIALIFDAGYGSDAIYHNKMPAQFFAALSVHGEVKSFQLGNEVPIAEVGQEPSNERPLQFKRALIGPILDQVSDDALVLVITKQDIIDLEDFDTPDWHRRMGFVTFNLNDAWPKVVRFDPTRPIEDQAKQIIQQFFLNSH